MGSLNVGKLYKRGSVWYFKITGPDGKRIQKSTGKKIKREAQEYANAYLEKVMSHGRIHEGQPLRTELAKYTDPETNPRYRQALLQETDYTLGYAHQVARQAQNLLTCLEKRLPHILDMPVSEITRRDMKEIQIAIAEERGKCRTAQHMFGTLKTIFSYLADDSEVPSSPGTGIPDIGYERKKLIAIEPDMIAWMISRKDLFSSHRSWAFMSILATTGMRKSEAMAISSDHIYKGTLLIDQQFSKFYDHPVKPKCGVIRTIPLSRLTQEVLCTIQPDENGRYFPSYKYSKIWTDVLALRAALTVVDQKNAGIWKTITPHLLRHSLNTNLIVAGCSELMTAEYMGWHHQEIMDMQRNYTHIKAKKLQHVADMIDEICTYHEEDVEKILTFSQQGNV